MFNSRYLLEKQQKLFFCKRCRCCLVYSARSVRDGTKVALKVYKRGPNYDGAVQREQYILDAFQQPSNKIGKFLKRMNMIGANLFNYHCRKNLFL